MQSTRSTNLNSGNQNLNSGLNNGLNNQNLNSGLGYQSQNFATSSHGTTNVLLPAQIMEKPLVVHEEIRSERVEEIQPVINIEKLQTEVHQVTQPLFDKEIKPVNISQRTLATEILPEVQLAGRGVSALADHSTVAMQASRDLVIEKPAIYTEVDKLQVIEEIQPVLYKETILPTVIQETKPVYQKIVEGPVYTQTTLPAQSLSGSRFVSQAASWNGPGQQTTYSQTTTQSGWNGQSGLNGQGLNGQSGFNAQLNGQSGLSTGLNNANLQQQQKTFGNTNTTATTGTANTPYNAY